MAVASFDSTSVRVVEPARRRGQHWHFANAEAPTTTQRGRNNKLSETSYRSLVKSAHIEGYIKRPFPATPMTSSRAGMTLAVDCGSWGLHPADSLNEFMVEPARNSRAQNLPQSSHVGILYRYLIYAFAIGCDPERKWSSVPAPPGRLPMNY